MSAPDRIWATGNGETGSWNAVEGRMKAHMPEDWQIEYVCADLCDPLQDDRVKALVEAVKEITNRAEFATRYDDDKYNFGWMIRKVRAALRDMGVEL
jgi:hypothetical protein